MLLKQSFLFLILLNLSISMQLTPSEPPSISLFSPTTAALALTVTALGTSAWYILRTRPRQRESIRSFLSKPLVLSALGCSTLIIGRNILLKILLLPVPVMCIIASIGSSSVVVYYVLDRSYSRIENMLSNRLGVKEIPSVQDSSQLQAEILITPAMIPQNLKDLLLPLQEQCILIDNMLLKSFNQGVTEEENKLIALMLNANLSNVIKLFLAANNERREAEQNSEAKKRNSLQEPGLTAAGGNLMYLAFNKASYSEKRSKELEAANMLKTCLITQYSSDRDGQNNSTVT